LVKEQAFHKRIAVYSEAEDDSLNNIAAQLQIPLLHSRSDDYDFYLLKINDALYLQNQDVKFCVDFSSGEMNFRRERGGGKNQAIGRAVGLKKLKAVKVLDATAGLGGDAFVLACLGCDVTMVERSRIIAALLKDGLTRGLLDENISGIIARMTLVNMEAKDYFSKFKEIPDVIYLDPMYPHRKKSAKVKKEMQILQNLLGHVEGGSLLKPALKVATKRVVVKRPKGAEYLENSAPSHSIESKKTRYDVYLCGVSQ